MVLRTALLAGDESLRSRSPNNFRNFLGRNNDAEVREQGHTGQPHRPPDVRDPVRRLDSVRHVNRVQDRREARRGPVGAGEHQGELPGEGSGHP